MKELPYKFISVVAVFVVVVFIINNINHNFAMNDFKVYYYGAHALLHKQPLYDVLFTLGSGYYKYSPFTALPFCILTVFTYYTACVIHFFITGICIVLTGLLIFRLLNTYVFHETIKSPNAILLLSALCIVKHLVRELTVGNVNVIMLLLVSLCPYFILKQRNGMAALVLALAIITKPFFILLFIPLLIYKNYRVVTQTVLMLLVLIFIPSVVVGFSHNILLHKEWLNSVFVHAAGFVSPDMLNSIIQNWIYEDMPRSAQYAILLIFIGVFYFFWSDEYKSLQGDKKANDTAFILQWFIMVAAMPSLLATDTEHFLMTWPLIMFLLIYLFKNGGKVFTTLFVLSIVMFGGNLSDLIGKKLSSAISDTGVLGLSNLIIIAMVFYICFKQWVNRKAVENEI